MKIDNTMHTCDVCGHEFKVNRKRYHCSHCDKYFFICPSCQKRDKIPCRFCGVKLEKKAEPAK